VIAVGPMTLTDLPTVEGWLALPHVARWWTPETTPQAEISNYRRRILGDEPTSMLIVTHGVRAIGWCQWYRWADYPAEAEAMDAEEGELGFDYVIGDPSAIGHGLGTQLIATLVAELRRVHPAAGLLVAPEAANTASRRVLEKNGFALVGIRRVATEPHDRPMAIYRLEPVSELDRWGRRPRPQTDG
jgi:aminoglycoside 6'-N-acetyltransferase